MTDLVTSFRDFVAREQLFTKADKLLLACSGGLDSTVLAHVLHAEGYDFAIAHMNFQLRGAASDGDAAFVEELARTLDAKCWLKALDVKGQAEPGESTQMTARRLRYDWFHELLREHNYACLLTAHHADDNLETVLINLLRGTGIHGIAGIQPKAGPVCRPFLTAGRHQLENYAIDRQLRWREDASNATDDYLRNRIRHQLTPMLYQDFGLKTENWVKTAANLRAGAALYNIGVSHLHSSRCESRGALWVVNRKGWAQQELATFLHEQVSVYDFNDEQIRQMLSMPGQRTLESDLAIVYISPEQLVFEFKASVSHRKPPAKQLSELPATDIGGGYYRITVEEVPRPEALDQPGVLYLAPPPVGDRASGPERGPSPTLHLRPRQKGDRFQPLGLGGKSKKVKDYMIDAKIPVWLRDRIYLLTNDQDEIMAIPGYCISEKFKVLPEHETVLSVRGW